MNKIILFFYFCIVSCVKSDIHSRFEIQYFENNITIREVYYQDHNRYNKIINYELSAINAKHVISIFKNVRYEGNLYHSQCFLSYNDYTFNYHTVSSVTDILQFDMYDCFQCLYISYTSHELHSRLGHLIINGYSTDEDFIYAFIERFYLYTQLEKINQQIKKYQINIDDLF